MSKPFRTFFNVEDLGDLHSALAEAQAIKRDRYAFQHLGKNKTLLMIFFNNSLRTRLSTQKAATNLGMNVIVLDVNAGAWKLETERGVIMDGDKSEHLLEAIPCIPFRLSPTSSPSRSTSPWHVPRWCLPGLPIAAPFPRPFPTPSPNG